LFQHGPRSVSSSGSRVHPSSNGTVLSATTVIYQHIDRTLRAIFCTGVDGSYGSTGVSAAFDAVLVGLHPRPSVSRAPDGFIADLKCAPPSRDHSCQPSDAHIQFDPKLLRKHLQNLDRSRGGDRCQARQDHPRRGYRRQSDCALSCVGQCTRLQGT